MTKLEHKKVTGFKTDVAKIILETTEVSGQFALLLKEFNDQDGENKCPLSDMVL